MRAFKVAFKCTACGKCCTGKGGKVRVNSSEIGAIADFLAIPPREFKKQQLRDGTHDGWRVLRQTADDTKCVFLQGNKCSIYPVRPTQCRTYPFWPQHMISKYDWALVGRECEGIQVNPSKEDTIVAEDRILRETVIHEVHRAGEEFTYDELDSFVDDLEPEMLYGFQEEVAAKYQREIRYEDDEVLVLDSFLDGLPPTRSLHFVDRLDLVQSEVFLTESGGIDHARFALDVHRGLSLALAMSKKREEGPWRVAIVGAGAGALPMFLRHNVVHPLILQAVEPSRSVLKAGKMFFDFEESQHTIIHRELGEDFVQHQPPRSVDIMLVDVEDGSQTSSVRAPPASMLTNTFLSDVHRLLTTSGVVAINVIAENSLAVENVGQLLHACFEHVWVLTLPANSVVFGLKTAKDECDWPLLSPSFHDNVQDVKLGLRRLDALTPPP